MPLFSTASFDFLRQLAANNDRTWFEPRKAEFQRLCRDPALRLIEALEAPLRALSPHFVASAKPIGGSLFRLHRDTRFSKDKSPYKPWLGIRLKHAAERERFEAPLFYVHLGPDACFAGGGLWHPAPTTLAKVRTFIAANPQTLTDVLAAPAFQRDFRRGGESVTRAPRGFDPAHPLIEEIKRKDFVAMGAIGEAQACSDALVDLIVEHFRGCAGLVDYLCAALDVEF